MLVFIACNYGTFDLETKAYATAVYDNLPPYGASRVVGCLLEKTWKTRELCRRGKQIMKVRVYVRLKPSILDPQGRTVLRAAQQMGYSEIQQVRIGKLIELDIDASDKNEVESRVQELSRKLLSNPQMEEFDLEWSLEEN